MTQQATFGLIPTKPTNRRARFDIRDQDEIGFELSFERAVMEAEAKIMPAQVQHVAPQQSDSSCCSTGPPVLTAVPGKRHGIYTNPPSLEEIHRHFNTQEDRRPSRRQRDPTKSNGRVTLTKRMCCCWCRQEVDRSDGAMVGLTMSV